MEQIWGLVNVLISESDEDCELLEGRTDHSWSSLCSQRVTQTAPRQSEVHPVFVG